MQGWIVAGAWLFAVLFGLVVLGFAGYELSWKIRRLNEDKEKLDRLLAELSNAALALRSSAERAGSTDSAVE